MKLQDLTDTEFEDFAEKCFEDAQLISNFCYENSSDFDYYCAEHDYRGATEKLEYSYCERYDDRFLDFCFKEFFGGKS